MVLIQMHLMFILAVVPSIALLFYIYWKDPQKEPVSQIVKAFFLGVAICIPVGFLETGVNALLFGAEGKAITLFGTTIEAFFVAALPEEAAKLLILWLVLRKNKYFDEHFDGIVYAVAVSLGFATIENIFYVIGSPSWVTVAISRSLLAVPGHYAFAVLMGYYYSLYHFVEPSKKNAFFILFMPFLLHGIYDALALSGTVNPVAGSIAFFALIYFCIKMQRFAQSRIKTLVEMQKAATAEPENV